jgi:hypothetical protein
MPPTAIGSSFGDIIERQPCCGFVMQRMMKFFIKGE